MWNLFRLGMCGMWHGYSARSLDVMLCNATRFCGGFLERYNAAVASIVPRDQPSMVHSKWSCEDFALALLSLLLPFQAVLFRGTHAAAVDLAPRTHERFFLVAHVVVSLNLVWPLACLLVCLLACSGQRPQAGKRPDSRERTHSAGRFWYRRTREVGSGCFTATCPAAAQNN